MNSDFGAAFAAAMKRLARYVEGLDSEAVREESPALRRMLKNAEWRRRRLGKLAPELRAKIAGYMHIISDRLNSSDELERGRSAKAAPR